MIWWQIFWPIHGNKENAENCDCRHDVNDDYGDNECDKGENDDDVDDVDYGDDDTPPHWSLLQLL